MQYVIISHTDADGWFSAAIVLRYLNSHSNATIKCFAYNYGQKTTTIEKVLDSYKDNYLIFMTDITLPDAFMTKYAKHIWHLDHHKSITEVDKPWKSHLYKNDSAITIEGYKDLSGNQAKQVAACELTWLKLFPNVSMPRAVYLAGRYDIWDLNEDALALQEYLFSRPVTKNNLKYLEPWFNELFTDTGIQEALIEGRDALKWAKRFDAYTSTKITTIVKMLGSTIAIANGYEKSSKFFEQVMKDHPEVEGIFVIMYHFKQGFWQCSCYSADTHQDWDALAFIQQFKDKLTPILAMGGHKNACGFEFKGDVQRLFDCIDEVL